MNFLYCLDKPIDYIGQSFTSKLINWLLTIGFIIAYIAGVISSNLKHTAMIAIGTIVFTFVLTVPSWPYLRRNPVKFKKYKKD